MDLQELQNLRSQIAVHCHEAHTELATLLESLRRPVAVNETITNILNALVKVEYIAVQDLVLLDAVIAHMTGQPLPPERLTLIQSGGDNG
jgi:hypothetical protein